MTHDIQESVATTIEKHNCNNENCGFRKFAAWFRPRATDQVLKFVEQAKEGTRLLFVRSNSDVTLYDVWVKNFETEALRQEHTCHACKRYLNGLGTFGIIAGDLDRVDSFALPDDDEAFELEVPHEYHKPYRAVLKAFYSSGWNIPLVAEIEDYGDIFGTEEAGGWSHMALEYARITRRQLTNLFTQQFANPQGTGLGRAEIKTSQDWLNTLIEFGETPIPLDKIRNSDKPVLEAMRKFAAIAVKKGVDRGLMIRADMIVNGLHFLRTRNTVIGVLVEDLAKGISLNTALESYGKYTDSRNYMRPSRLPSEGKFAQDVKFLTENGYDKFMPMRLATMDDLREYGSLMWEEAKPEVIAQDIDENPLGIFGKQASKMQAAKGNAPKERKWSNVGTERISHRSLVLDVFNKPELIDSIIFAPNSLYWGSFAVPHVVEGNNLFENGEMVRSFIAAEQIPAYNAHRYYKFDVPQKFTAYRIAKDKETDAHHVYLIADNCQWLVPISPPLFAASLNKELRECRHTIEDYMRQNPMNVDLEGKVVPIENAVLSVPLLVNHSITIRFKDGIERSYYIASEK